MMQLNRWNFKTEISHIHISELPSEALSVGPGMEEPISVLFSFHIGRKWLKRAAPKNHRRRNTGGNCESGCC